MMVNNIEVPSETDGIVESVAILRVEGKFSGHVAIAGELKEDAHQAIKQIRKSGIFRIIMLSGDKGSITQQVSKELNIDWAKGGLFPEDKLNEVEELKKQPDTKVAFIGDGVNDTPVLAVCGVGIAMGRLG